MLCPPIRIHAQLGPALTSIGIHRAGIKLIQRYVGSLADEHLVVGKDMFEQLRSVRRLRATEHSAAASTGIASVATPPRGPSPVSVQARCHNINFWDVGCDTDLFRPDRRSEDCAEGSLRWRMTGGKPHLSAFGQGRGGLRRSGSTRFPPHADLVVHVGRLCVEKGIAILPALLDRFNGPANDRQTVVVRRGSLACVVLCSLLLLLPGPFCVQFCVIGDGPFKAPLEELCRGKNLVTLGPIPHVSAAAARAALQQLLKPQ